MDRFSNVVRFSMFGHTHDESFNVVKSMLTEEKNVGLNFISGSLTTYTNNNPSFSIIEIDSETLIPVSY